MRFRRPQAIEPDIQLAPLIDVILLLLLFYSVAANFVDQPRIDLQLPAAGSGVPVRGSEPLLVTVEADGGYVVNGRALPVADVASLRSALAAELQRLGAGAPGAGPAMAGQAAAGQGAAAAGGTTVPVTILGDAHAPHQAVVGAMDAARQLGIASVRIATRNSAEGG